MINNSIIAVLVGAVIVTGAVMAGGLKGEENTIAQNGVLVMLHKSPSCGCCGQYGNYLSQKGYTVEVQQTANMTSVKEDFGVPYELESCHTSEIGDYIVEGHVPEEAIDKLLTERPDIKGIGMAGMPSGSPGMPGPKETFEIYTITHEGTKGELFMTL